MSTSAEQIVRLDDIRKSFGDITACDGVDFSLEEGQIHGLVGENGAGKTTLMKILYGLYKPDSGEIFFKGDPVTFASPRDANAMGIGMIHQHFMLVDNMTVLQNIVLGHEPDNSAGVVSYEKAKEEIANICDTYGFDVVDYLDSEIQQIGVGAQQRVEIVKSLFRGADILILDEPTAVLTPQEVDSLFRVMSELKDRGHSIIFITHKLDEAIEASDQITVLRDGENMGTTSSSETTREELSRMMVGRDILFDVDKSSAEYGEPILEVQDLFVRGDRGVERVSGVDCKIREGEILGIAGVEGNGQKEFIQAITGLRETSEGSIQFKGQDISGTSRREIIRSGVSYVPEDRLRSGLVSDYSLVENGLLANQFLEGFNNRGFIDWNYTRKHAQHIVDKYDVTPPAVDLSATSYSGGNQQKFVVGRELEHHPDLVVAANPTRGLDVGSTEFIRDQLLNMRDEGVAILMKSSKLDEIEQISDRIAVMYNGRFVDIVDPQEVTIEELGLLMTGQDIAVQSGKDPSSRSAQATSKEGS